MSTAGAQDVAVYPTVSLLNPLPSCTHGVQQTPTGSLPAVLRNCLTRVSVSVTVFTTSTQYNTLIDDSMQHNYYISTDDSWSTTLTTLDCIRTTA